MGQFVAQSKTLKGVLQPLKVEYHFLTLHEGLKHTSY